MPVMEFPYTYDTTTDEFLVKQTERQLLIIPGSEEGGNPGTKQRVNTQDRGAVTVVLQVDWNGKSEFRLRAKTARDLDESNPEVVAAVPLPDGTTPSLRKMTPAVYRFLQADWASLGNYVQAVFLLENTKAMQLFVFSPDVPNEDVKILSIDLIFGPGVG